jgi:hypothetical protein
MNNQPIEITEIYQQISDSVKRNLHLLNEGKFEKTEISAKVGYNRRIVISDCREFLEAIKVEIGGEIMEDSKIGQFLYYGELRS